MEGPLLVLATLALLCLCRGENLECCKNKNCPDFQKLGELPDMNLNVEKRWYGAMEVLKYRLTEQTVSQVKEGNIKLAAYCKKLADMNPASKVNCKRWPVEVALEHGSAFVIWLISHEGTLNKPDGEDPVESETKPPQSVYVLKYNGMPDRETGIRKHAELVEVLSRAGVRFEPRDFVGACYGFNKWLQIDNEIWVVAFD